MGKEKKDGFVTLNNFLTPEEAVVFQSMLQSMGIPCAVLDDTMAMVARGSFFGRQANSVRVMIRAEDHELVQEILASEFDHGDMPAE